jgi:hypothetical protein
VISWVKAGWSKQAVKASNDVILSFLIRWKQGTLRNSGKRLNSHIAQSSTED